MTLIPGVFREKMVGWSPGPTTVTQEKNMAEATNPAQKKAVHPIDGTPPSPPHLSLHARVESGSYDRDSMPRCSCLPVGSPDNPKDYHVNFRVPDVSISKNLVAEFLGTFIRRRRKKGRKRKREGDFSLPADMAAMRIRLISAADVDTTPPTHNWDRWGK